MPSSGSRTSWSSGRELYGDELVELLERSKLEVPTIDLLEEDAWPKI